MKSIQKGIEFITILASDSVFVCVSESNFRLAPTKCLVGVVIEFPGLVKSVSWSFITSEQAGIHGVGLLCTISLSTGEGFCRFLGLPVFELHIRQLSSCCIKLNGFSLSSLSSLCLQDPQNFVGCTYGKSLEMSMSYTLVILTRKDEHK